MKPGQLVATPAPPEQALSKLLTMKKEERRRISREVFIKLID
jgi:hypothetical protein